MIGGDNDVDASHLEATIRIEADYFVTNNPQDFMYDGKKEALEKLFPNIRIVIIEELEEKIVQDLPTDSG